jgi:small subunit ribosomal protein S17
MTTEKTCTDKHCQQHGTIRLRGRTLTGKVTSAKAARTVTVEWEYRKYMQKYERYDKRGSKVKAHNPDCINAKEGDTVIIRECRPISKTKQFVVTQVRP